jgi:uncharacterized protein YfaS (alpha-2-macroglobulin family)
MSNHLTPDRLDALLHGLLEPAEAAEVERLASASPEGQARLAAARQRFAAMSLLAQTEASEDLIQRTVAGVERSAVRRRMWFRRYLFSVTAAALAGVAVLGGMQWHYRNLTVSPVDLRVLGQSQLLAGSNGSMRVRVLNADSRGPMAGVPVQMTLVNAATREVVRLADFQTDARGTASPRFALPDWPSGNHTLKIVAQTDHGPEETTQTVSLKRESKLMLSSDKPLYQPGQTIHLRALALRRPDLKPVADGESLLTIADPQGNIIFKHRGRTSRFGIVSADCPLATEILEGNYQVNCRIGDTESQLTLPVEKYVLPKFKVALTLDKSYYQPGDAVKGTVQADYFFGKAVAGGHVNIAAQTVDVEVTNISQSQIKIPVNGKVEFDFMLPESLVGREQDNGDATIQVVAEVVDTADQKHAVAEKRTVTAHPLRIEVIPEAGTPVKGLPNTVYVLATYADGRPAQSTVTFNGEPSFTTSPLGVGKFEVTPQGDVLNMHVTAVDADGLKVQKQIHLTCGATSSDFILRTDRSVYRGGDSIHLAALGGGVEPVFVDILKDRQTLLTQTIDMQNGHGEATIDLPPDGFGTIELNAYRFNDAGLPVMKTRTLYVDAANQLKVKVERDADEYRPGGTAKLSFTLTDDAGKPTPGALSLAAVDEAVFHVLKQRPGLEGTFFNLEQELLEPVYAIYPWSPFAGRGPALPPDDAQLVLRNELERALFSETARPVDVRGLNMFATGNSNDGGFGGFGSEGSRFIVDSEVDGIPNAGRRSGPDSSRMASPISLALSTYPAKFQQLLAAKIHGERQAVRGWVLLLIAFGVVAGLTLLYAMPLFGLGVVARTGILIGALVIGFMVTSVLMLSMAGGEKSAMVMTGAVEVFEANLPLVFDASGSLGGIGAMAGEEVAAGEEGPAPLRVRQQFPETLLWQPQLITDDNGRATLEVPLADSITNWRLSASAVSAAGQLGAIQDGVRVFQPFFVDLNLPVALTRNDEVSIPVVVYNYLSEPQTVELVLEQDEWFELLPAARGVAGDEAIRDLDSAAVAELPNDEGKDQGNATPQANAAADKRGAAAPTTIRIELKPNEIKATNFRLKAKQVGQHKLQATARSITRAGIADALRRDIAIEPEGRAVEVVQNGSLTEPVEMALTVPEEAIPGSAKAIVKLYPSTFSQLVEGLDAIFQRPYGCFEQTSSTTYPNILALDYLRTMKKSAPEVEAKARQYIHLGYQRLMGFEVTHEGVRGGFDWFGGPPAKLTLTAYGLLEFTDMAKVHDVDPALIERTRAWLMSQRQPDGSWKADVHTLHEGVAAGVQRSNDRDLATTAYVAWAVFGSAATPQAANPDVNAKLTLNYLLAQDASKIESPYVLAMLANAIVSIDPENAAVKPLLVRLDGLKKIDPSGKKIWWEMPQQAETCFYGAGQSGHIEVTALATLAMIEAKHAPATIRNALNWLVEQKDPRGTWHSTQATILALKALLKGTASPVGAESPRTLDLLVDNQIVQTITIPVDQSDVMQQVNLSTHFASGKHTLKLVDRTGAGTGFQVTFRHHLPEEPAEKPSEPLQIGIVYDKTKLSVNDVVTATATVTNAMSVEAPMVILDLPIPAGFRMETDGLRDMVAQGQIAKFQQNARSTVVYLRSLKPGETLTLTYELQATMPVKLTVPAPVAYEYYNPTNRGTGKPLELVVNPLAH